MPKSRNCSSLEPQQCVVCLETVSTRGRLPVCDHYFCYTCIYEWSKNTNTCPLCKKRFRCIIKTGPCSPMRKVRVSDKDQTEHYDENDENEVHVPSLEEALISYNSLEDFIVSDDTPSDSDTDDTAYLGESFHEDLATPTRTYSTPLQTRSQAATLQVVTSPVSPWQHKVPKFEDSMSDDDDNYKIAPPNKRPRRRVLCTPPHNTCSSNDLLSSPFSPWQPLIRVRARQCISDSSSEDDEMIVKSPLVKSSGWLSSRQHAGVADRVKLYKRHCCEDSDREWSPFDL